MVLELFSQIGPEVRFIHFNEGSITAKRLFQLLCLIPNVEAARFHYVDLIPSPSFQNPPDIPHQFKKLKKLRLNSEDVYTDEDFYTHVFREAKGLEKLTCNVSFDIIGNKFRLKKLKIGGCHELNFNVVVEENSLQLDYLNLRGMNFNADTYKKFARFVKTQKYLKKFTFDFHPHPEYDGILDHVFSLKSLIIVETLSIDVFKNYYSHIRHRQVQMLVVGNERNNDTNNALASHVQHFPDIIKLHYSVKNLPEENIYMINNLKRLQDLNIVALDSGTITKEKFDQIQIANLKVFQLYKIRGDSTNVGNFHQFTLKNPKIENLTLKLNYWIGLEALENIVQNLKNLKNLVITDVGAIGSVELSPKIYEIIGENAKNLEYLELDLADSFSNQKELEEFIEKAADYLDQVLPKLSYNFESQ